MIQEHVGALGASTAVGTGFIGWVADAIPLFQAFSLLVSALVGVATLAWYVVRFADRIADRSKQNK